MTIGVQLEYDAGASPDPDKPDDDNDTPFTRRHSNLYLGGEWGKLTVGQASTATDNMAFANLGGPSWLAGVTNSCAFYSDGPACESNDGGRRDILKYDTPSLGPASIAISAGNDDYWDVMLKIAGSLGDAGYDFRIGHIAKVSDTTRTAASTSMASQTVHGRELLTTLFNEGDNSDVTGFQDSNDVTMPDYTLTNTAFEGLESVAADDDAGTLAMDPLEAHLAANPNVELDRVGGTGAGEGSFADNVYRKTTTTTTPASSMTTESGDITTASLGVAFGQGTSVWAAWSQDNTGDDEYQYISVDHSYGDGSVGVFYKTAEKAGVDGSIRGVGFGHAIGGGATVYAGFRQHEEDGKEDIDVLLAGIRVTFN